MTTIKPMYTPLVTIQWCPIDVREICPPEWTDEQCIDFLEEVGTTLEERSIEHGWNVLENLLDNRS